MSLLFSPDSLPERITSGDTVYCLSRVGDRAYYTPYGYFIEDELHCWCVKTDSPTGRAFFANCGGLGNCWALPDMFSENYRKAIAELHGSGTRTLSSPPFPSSCTRGSSSQAVATPDVRPPVASSARGIFSHSSPPPPRRSAPLSSSSPPMDIYAEDMAYLHAFDSADGAPAADQTPLLSQLRQSVAAYADEVAGLRRRLEEERRVALEKDFALVEVEEWMVSTRLRMMEVLAAWRQTEPFR